MATSTTKASNTAQLNATHWLWPGGIFIQIFASNADPHPHSNPKTIFFALQLQVHAERFGQFLLCPALLLQ